MVTDPQLRALRLLAGAGAAGLYEAILVHVHGIAVDVLVELINAGLATARTERTRVGDQQIEIRRLQITDTGRKAIG